MRLLAHSRELMFDTVKLANLNGSIRRGGRDVDWCVDLQPVIANKANPKPAKIFMPLFYLTPFEPAIVCIVYGINQDTNKQTAG